MGYTYNSQYTPYFRVIFKDVDGGNWVINIYCDKELEGVSGITVLTGGENPFEWTGTGTEDQTQILRGSTGVLRLVVTDETEWAYRIGMLLPTSNMSRRVIAFRNEELMWMGFLKCEQYSQSFDRKPYDVELNCVSFLELAKDVAMPDIVCPSGEEMKVSHMIDTLMHHCGLPFDELITNMPYYEKYDGTTDNSDWMDNKINSNIVYNFSGGKGERRTIAECLNIIFSPYGRIYDNADVLYISLDKSNYDGTRRFDDTELYVRNSNGWDFDNSWRIPSLSIGSDILSGGTDNTVTVIDGPKKVTLSSNVQSHDETMLLLDTSYFKLENRVSDVENTTYDSDYYYAIQEFENDMIDSNGDFEILDFEEETSNDFHKKPYIEKYRSNRTTKDVDKSESLYYHIRSVDSNGNVCNHSHTIKPSRLFVEGKTYEISFDDNGKCWEGMVGLGLGIEIITDNGKWIIDNEIFNTKQIITISSNEVNSILFKMPDDYSSKLTFKLYFKGTSYMDRAIEYVKFYVSEYYYNEYLGKNNIMKFIEEETNNTKRYLTSDKCSGEEFELSFLTYRGIDRKRKVSEMYDSGFCDSDNYVDMEPRKIIDMNECIKSNILPEHVGGHGFVKYPFRMVYEEEVYIPVAIGINCRNNTARLKLVSTNL